MTEYVEPTTEQLARFLIVYIPSQAGLDLHPSQPVIEYLLETKPDMREAALVHHRKFYAQINELHTKMMAGDLLCEFIRPNGKKCPNHNEPGSYYCGLHRDLEEP